VHRSAGGERESSARRNRSNVQFHSQIRRLSPSPGKIWILPTAFTAENITATTTTTTTQPTTGSPRRRRVSELCPPVVARARPTDTRRGRKHYSSSLPGNKWLSRGVRVCVCVRAEKIENAGKPPIAAARRPVRQQ